MKGGGKHITETMSEQREGERMSSGTQTFNSASVWDNRTLIIHLPLCGVPLNIDSGAF